jgi:hypothetical protein
VHSPTSGGRSVGIVARGLRPWCLFVVFVITVHSYTIKSRNAVRFSEICNCMTQWRNYWII